MSTIWGEQRYVNYIIWGTVCVVWASLGGEGSWATREQQRVYYCLVFLSLSTCFDTSLTQQMIIYCSGHLLKLVYTV